MAISLSLRFFFLLLSFRQHLTLRFTSVEHQAESGSLTPAASLNLSAMVLNDTFMIHIFARHQELDIKDRWS